MNFLVIHKYGAGQFRHLIQSITESSRHRVVSIGEVQGPETTGLDLQRYFQIHYCREQPQRAREEQWVRRFQDDLSHGRAVLRQLQHLKRSGFVPDVILAHSGWGEPLFCKDIFPDVPLVGYFEHFYRSQGGEADFFPEQALSLEARSLIRTLNAAQLLALVDCDAGVSPTAWQRNGFPSELRGKIHHIHEGVDVEYFLPSREASFPLRDGKRLAAGTEVVTYVSRSLEPFRGFPQFMEGVAELLRRRPTLQVLVAGGDEVTYSPPLPNGMSYREELCRRLDLDLSRIHFLGWVRGDAYRRLLQVSSAHVYLTPPFVLSWSLIEAMAAGCAVVASDTEPVREVIRDGENGLLFDFFSTEQLVNRVEAVLDHPPRMGEVRTRARNHVAQHYDARRGVERYFRLIESLTGRTVQL